MPRYARFHITGGLFHVISRFHDRRYYLDIDGAREQYLSLLGQACRRHDARIVAYCLMSSHIHLVVQLGCDPLGQLMKRVHSPFGNWVNANRKGIGSIMADRPRSVLVHKETYGMELIRYVHNNPVRAGIVSRASKSNWTSHRAYLGLSPCPDWLATEAILGPDEHDHEVVRHELACFVDEGRREERRPEFSGEVSPVLAKRIRKLMSGNVELSYPVLGPDNFVESVLKEQVSRHNGKKVGGAIEGGAKTLINEVFEGLSLDPRDAVRRIRPVPVARGRALAAWLWVEKMSRPQSMIADGLCVGTNAVGKMLTKLRQEDGPTQKETKVLNKVFRKLTEDKNEKKQRKKVATNRPEPTVVVLKRKR